MAITRSFHGLVFGLLLGGLSALPALAERPPLAELWVQTSAEYRAMSYQTYRTAELQFEKWQALLEKRADGKAYLPGSSKPVAIILDLDETVIDNSGYQAYSSRNNASYNDEIWAAWIEFQGINEKAGPPVPGAVEFLSKVEKMGVTPIYISNRTVGQESSTTTVLRRAGINVEGMDERLMLRLPSKEETARGESVMKTEKISPASVEGDRVTRGEGKKEARRRLIAQKYDVVAYFGDQLGDFEAYVQKPGELTAQSYKPRQAEAEAYRQYWGTTWFILPNPMYGYWGPGMALPAADPASSMQDYGFEVYLRGRRAPAVK